MNVVKTEQQIWADYYKKALSKSHSEFAETAVENNRSGMLVATDCGCGTGADIQYLYEHGYVVHAFDKQEKSIQICKERFTGNANVNLSVAEFENYDYQSVGIFLAASSLFFADSFCFDDTWSKITNSIATGGVFAGNFIGFEDDWVKHRPEHMCPVDEEKLSVMFDGFDIVKKGERKHQGKTLVGQDKFWHAHSVVAVKD